LQQLTTSSLRIIIEESQKQKLKNIKKKIVNLNSMAFGKYGNIYHHKIPVSFGFAQDYFFIVGW
jgi:hypothetical protein